MKTVQDTLTSRSSNESEVSSGEIVPTEQQCFDSTHDHTKAAEYLQELTAKILSEHGQDKLDELYVQVDKFQKELASNGFYATNFRNQFGLCAESEREATNKDFGMHMFLCLVEETFDNIVTIFSDMPYYQQTLNEYKVGVASAYYALDEEGQKLIGDLYPGYVADEAL